MNKIKQKFLEQHKEDLQKGIWGLEFDICHLDRQKITARDGAIDDIEKGISIAKAKIKSYESRIKLIDDMISGIYNGVYSEKYKKLT